MKKISTRLWRQLSAATLVMGLLAPAGSTASSMPAMLLSELFYDASGADNGLEWVELYNPSSTTVILDGLSLGFGGASYATISVALQGVIGPDSYFVVGGPTSVDANANPHFDQLVNFTPDLQNSGHTADAMGLFDVDVALLSASSLPFGALVYGVVNTNGFVDARGQLLAVHVADAPSGHSLERTVDNRWRISSSPSPRSGPLSVVSAPEPSTLLLLLSAFAGLSLTVL